MNISRRSIVTLAIGAIIFAPPLAIAQSALPARSNDAGGVRVVVKPKSIAPDARWDFDVAMDTHVKPLVDDLTKTAVLIDAAGRRYQPVSWQGDAPGGHHRNGVLRFPAPAGQTTSFEIQIQGMGGVNTRVFQWTMK
jgi:hypothetical protein